MVMSKTAREVIAAVEVCADDLTAMGEDNARNVIEALDTAGFVIVPKEPTAAMLEAGHGYCLGEHPNSTIEGGMEQAKYCYQDMIAAAKVAS